jgi:hypothetical protein
MYDELYQPQFDGNSAPPPLGFVVAGYSARESGAEVWRIDLDSATERPVPVCEAPQQVSGWAVYAQDEAIKRLFGGYDPSLPVLLSQHLDEDEVREIVPMLDAFLLRRPAQAAMPFGDAVSLARFMVDVTAGYSHYLLGADTVGGPVEVAGITRHEGFKWISRKHYYAADLNPEEPGHDY